MTPGLLVSVRDVKEAAAALDGGATLIDVKEPANGALGKADDDLIHSVIEFVDHRIPVSVALGEWTENLHKYFVVDGADFYKMGPARGRGRQCERWPHGSSIVTVAYADWERTDAPTPGWLLEVAKREPCVYLIDTGVKDGSTLLDWIGISELGELVAEARSAGIRVALAGSLGVPELERLLPLRPDWFAVRGAVCEGGRGGRVDALKVRELARLIGCAP